MRPASPEEKAILQKLSPEQVSAKELAGEKIEAMLTTAPSNGAAHRRPESRDAKRMVCREAFGHGGRIQDLR